MVLYRKDLLSMNKEILRGEKKRKALDWLWKDTCLQYERLVWPELEMCGSGNCKNGVSIDLGGYK